MRPIWSTTVAILALIVPEMALGQNSTVTTQAAPAAGTSPQGKPAAGIEQRAKGPSGTPLVQRGDVDVSIQPPNVENPLYPVRGQRLMGQTLYGTDGSEIGEVKDVVMDRQSQITAAVVAVSGFLGMDTREVAVPIKDIKLGSGERLTANITAEQAKAIPTKNPSENQSAPRAKGTGTGSTQ